MNGWQWRIWRMCLVWTKLHMCQTMTCKFTHNNLKTWGGYQCTRSKTLIPFGKCYANRLGDQHACVWASLGVPVKETHPLTTAYPKVSKYWRGQAESGHNWCTLKQGCLQDTQCSLQDKEPMFRTILVWGTKNGPNNTLNQNSMINQIVQKVSNT